MATHDISKHTINLKQEEFSTPFLLQNILKRIFTVKIDFYSKAFLIQIFKKLKLKRSGFPSPLPPPKNGSQIILQKNILFYLLDFVFQATLSRTLGILERLPSIFQYVFT